MKIEKIESDNNILALIVRSSDLEEGLNFVTQEKDFVQVGLWKYEKGKELLPHLHLEAKREVLTTQEVVLIKKGRLRADIFSEKEMFIKSVELGPGDVLVCLYGGHGYQILEDDTEVLEVKNGPYVGPDKDRKRIAKT